MKKAETLLIKVFGIPDGVPGAIRTRGLSLRRRTLYPAELREHRGGFRRVSNPYCARCAEKRENSDAYDYVTIKRFCQCKSTR
jgi:hypothetical protein